MTYKIGFQQTEVFAVISGIITTVGGTYLKDMLAKEVFFLNTIN